MDALEVLFTRRSIRKYTDQPIADGDVETMLKAAMLAPSANNKQHRTKNRQKIFASKE